MSLDLKDAYLHVQIHPSNWRYLRFALRNQQESSSFINGRYTPFGFATAARVLNSWLL